MSLSLGAQEGISGPRGAQVSKGSNPKIIGAFELGHRERRVPVLRKNFRLWRVFAYGTKGNPKIVSHSVDEVLRQRALSSVKECCREPHLLGFSRLHIA